MVRCLVMVVGLALASGCAAPVVQGSAHAPVERTTRREMTFRDNRTGKLATFACVTVCAGTCSTTCEVR